MQIRCNFPDISYLSETQKNNFQFLSKSIKKNRKKSHFWKLTISLLLNIFQM